MAETTKNLLWIGADKSTIQTYLELAKTKFNRNADYFELADDGLVEAASTKYPLIIVRDIVGASNDFARRHNLQQEDYPAFSQELIRVIASKGLNSKTPIIAIGTPTRNYIEPAKYIAAGAREFWNLMALNSRGFEENFRRVLV